MKHTKGKWTTKISNKKEYAGDLIFSESGQLIADCNISNMPVTETKANAKLISAAPDLLEVANAILLENDMRKETGLPLLTNTLIEIAKAAIKKATN